MRHYSACVVLFLSSISTALAQGDGEEARASLKGLRGVTVVVERLPPEVQQAGLTAADIRTDVEHKLRLAGIPVLSAGDVWAPTIYVNANVTKVVTKTNVFWPMSIEVQLQQPVRLKRDPTITLFGTTWSATGVGETTKPLLRSSILDGVNGYVDQFITAYLAVNPKR